MMALEKKKKKSEIRHKYQSFFFFFNYFQEIENITPKSMILALQLLLMRQTVISWENISFGISFDREMYVLAAKL